MPDFADAAEQVYRLLVPSARQQVDNLKYYKKGIETLHDAIISASDDFNTRLVHSGVNQPILRLPCRYSGVAATTEQGRAYKLYNSSIAEEVEVLYQWVLSSKIQTTDANGYIRVSDNSGIYRQVLDFYYTANLNQIRYESEFMRDLFEDHEEPYAVVYHFIEHDHLGFVWNNPLDRRRHHFERGSFPTATCTVRIAMMSKTALAWIDQNPTEYKLAASLMTLTPTVDFFPLPGSPSLAPIRTSADYMHSSGVHFAFHSANYWSRQGTYIGEHNVPAYLDLLNLFDEAKVAGNLSGLVVVPIGPANIRKATLTSTGLNSIKTRLSLALTNGRGLLKKQVEDWLGEALIGRSWYQKYDWHADLLRNVEVVQIERNKRYVDVVAMDALLAAKRTAKTKKWLTLGLSSGDLSRNHNDRVALTETTESNRIMSTSMRWTHNAPLDPEDLDLTGDKRASAITYVSLCASTSDPEDSKLVSAIGLPWQHARSPIPPNQTVHLTGDLSVILASCTDDNDSRLRHLVVQSMNEVDECEVLENRVISIIRAHRAKLVNLMDREHWLRALYVVPSAVPLE